ncbi:hypothetical protein SDJN02_19042, partial [Cucurbita argyrosperma subsp. argyrosperma]
MSEASINASSTPKLSNSTTRIFSDVAGDITIAVHGESFLLHKTEINNTPQMPLLWGRSVLVV